MKLKVFVGSSTEGLGIANAIQELLEHDADVSVWYQGIFELSSNSLDDLNEALDTFDFGIFVFSPDDVLKMRGEQYSAIRDNVLFEFGLFIGRLGKRRNFMLLPREHSDLRLPSDLIGLTPATYDSQRAEDDLLGALGPACNKIRRVFNKFGPIDRSPKKLIVPDSVQEQVFVAENPKKALISGMDLVRSLIAKAFGPDGIYVSISTHNREASSHKDGLLIARAIRATNPLAERGIAQIRRIAEDVHAIVGDGSKTSMLVAYSIIKNGQDAIDSGLTPNDLITGIRRAINLATAYLSSEAKRLRTEEDILNVTATAAGDRDLASLVVDAMDKVGKDGVISIERSNSEHTSLDVREGMRLDCSYLSDHLITDPYSQRCVLRDCYILIYEKRISSFRENLDLLEQIAQEGKPLLIIADDVDGEALPTMVLNKSRGTLPCAAIKAPGSGEFRRALLQDIAVLTGGKAITDDLGVLFASITIEDLGQAKEVVIDSETTTIFEGAGSMDSIEGRARIIRGSIERASSEVDIGRLQARLANLVSGVAAIRVGGISQEERDDNNYKITSAMYSTKAAFEEGIVAGGGTAFFRAAQHIENLTTENEADKIGAAIVVQALKEPLMQIVSNANCDINVLLPKMYESSQSSVGFNAYSRGLEDLVSAGIIDSSKVLRKLLEISYSHIKLILRTGDWNLSNTTIHRSEGEIDY